MTPDTHDMHEMDALEAEMAGLFAETAVEPDEFALTRMAERAKDVPEREGGFRLWVRRAFGGRMLLLAGSVCALALVAGLAMWTMSGKKAQNQAPGQSQAEVMMADASTATPAQAQAPMDDELMVDDEDLALLDDDSGLGLDALHLPEDPTEAEAMLDAYDDMLGGS